MGIRRVYGIVPTQKTELFHKTAVLPWKMLQGYRGVIGLNLKSRAANIFTVILYYYFIFGEECPQLESVETIDWAILGIGVRSKMF